MGEWRMDKTDFVILFIAFFILMPSATAYYSGTSQTVGTIDSCFGNMTIKVKASTDIIAGDYSMQGCKSLPDNQWSCPCQNPTPIIITTANESENTYTILVQTYIQQPSKTGDAVADDAANRDITRINTFSNIKFEIDKTVEPLVMPSLDDIDGIIVVVIIVIVIIAGIAAAAIFFMNKGNQLDDEVTKDDIKRMKAYNKSVIEEIKRLEKEKREQDKLIKK